jgi:polyhydroxyalkanoate synthase
VHLMGLCAGGMTAAALLGHLAAKGELGKIRSLSLLVSMLDTAHDSQLAALSSRRAIESSLSKANKQGVHRGSDMARLFAWLRPNDLVFNYVVNNWLLGQDPPAFDVLAWNADTTNLPAGLYRDFIHLYEGNRLREPFGLTVLGTPVDLAKVDVDAYAVAGSTDHIVPWQAAWATTQILGGDVEFVLSNSGHIQSLVNPLGNPKASYFAGDGSLRDADAWVKSAQQQKGSWWQHWVEWVRPRSGEERPAPQALGDTAHPPLVPAPGVYVTQTAD